MEPPCDACTAICCKFRGYDYSVILEPEEADAFPEAVRSLAENAMVIPSREGKCIFLDPNDKCSIYERRPIRCQQFNCTVGYRCKPDGRHSFLLEDYPKLVELIELRLKS